MSKKSQMFSLDMIIALCVFIAILIASASAWDNARERIYLQEQRNDLELIARNAISSLILTTGEPADWHNLDKANFNEINVKSLGLTNSTPYRLNRDKVQYLADLNIYDIVKRILGIMGPNYEFFLEIKTYDRTGFSGTDTIGLAPDETAKEIVIVERSADYGSDWARVKLGVWNHE